MATKKFYKKYKSNSTTANSSMEDGQDKNNNLFPIVGIGASAGGLDAFTQLLEHLPNDTGMGFVLIQHLSPNNKSLLTEVLAKKTQMPVRSVKDGMSVEPNHIYIIPPNTKMLISQGILKLSPREKTDGKYMPVDSLLISLAADRGNKAIGVVLSGGDEDGSLGVQAIKAAAGITFAQCEQSAKFDSMPHKAAATGSVDFIMPPQEIAAMLAKISRNPYITHPTPEKTIAAVAENQDRFQKILTLLGSFTGVDFTYYQPATLLRRLARRIILHKISSLEDYVTYLEANHAEVEALFEDVLIHVTSFFRNSETFVALKNNIFPRIMAHKSRSAPIRIWVAGCSTGEEAYSLAICLVEFFEDLEKAEIEPPLQSDSQAAAQNEAFPGSSPERGIRGMPPIKIFGTDISDTAIEKARIGIYTARELLDVSPERLERFFVQVEGGYKIAKSIRELCIFSKHNLGQDPPFVKLDLVTCRNVLIYFTTALQKQILQVFHYSLNSNGFLLLGNAESAGALSDLFALADKKNKIYSRNLSPSRLIFDFGASNYPLSKAGVGNKTKSDTGNSLDIQKEADRIVLNKYAPQGAIVNNDMDIVQFRGDTSPYLRPAPGKPSFNILKMAREGLLLELRTALHQAKHQNIPVRKSGLQVKYNEEFRNVSIQIVPFQVPSVESSYFLVLFEDASRAAIATSNEINSTRVKAGNGEQAHIEADIIQLEQELIIAKEELAANKEYLHSIIENREATNQELLAASEEMMSINEEFQVTNEELETVKEELQATNEQLNTINEELRTSNIELKQVSDDLLNLLNSVNIPILMLGNDLRIRRFTPNAEKIINLLPTDVGRPIGNIKTNIKVTNLESLIKSAIDTVKIIEREIQDFDERWYNMRIIPYTTRENTVDGAVVVLIDINELKRSAEQIKEARDLSESIVRTVQQPLVVLDAELKVKTVNSSFCNTFQLTPPEIEQQAFLSLGNGEWDSPHLRRVLLEVIPKDSKVDNFEVNHVFEKIGPKTMLLNACKIPQEGDVIKLMLLAIEDITERKQIENQRTQLLADEQAARAAAEAANRTKDEFLSLLSHELRTPLSAIIMWVQLLLSRNIENAKTTRALEMIEHSALAQNKLIEELLDISRITTGKLSLQCSEVELVPTISAAIDLARVGAEAKNIQIETRLNPATVWGDADRLQQVMWNLLSNAIKFTPSGGRVEVSLDPVGSQAQISVSDTGIGIGAEFLPYVFDRFRQADSTSTRSHDGLGLGLTIVRHLVELHGGTVGASSLGEGQGTTMVVRLPLIASLEASSLSRGNSQELIKFVSVPLDRIPTLTGLRVLVVDDNADTLYVLTTMLEEYGAEVTAVGSALEALGAIVANPGLYDVLLSDLAMPETDGYNLIRQVRVLGAELGGQIPAAALTAYLTGENRADALKAGFQMHIAKPIEPARLARIVAILAGRTNTL